MSDSSIAVGQIVADAAPYVIAIVGAVVIAGLRRLSVVAEKALHIQETQAEQAKIDGDIATVVAKAEVWAGKIVAADPANLAGKSIEVGNPVIARAVNSISKDLPDRLKDRGWDANSVANLVLGKIGAIQAPPPAPLSPVPPGAIS